MSVLFLKDRTITIKSLPIITKNVKKIAAQNLEQKYIEIPYGPYPANPLNDPILKEVNDAFQTQILSYFNKNTLMVKLIGVNSISFSFESTIAMEPGVSMAFMQPWYIKPASISVKGHSSLGAFQYISKDDKQIEDIYKIYVGALQELKFTKDSRVFELDIANNPQGTDKFMGYITKFDFTEEIDVPFLIKYDLSFIGKPIVQAKQDQAFKNAISDQAILKVVGR